MTDLPEGVRVEHPAPGVATLVVERRRALNALDPPAMDALARALEGLHAQVEAGDVRAVVICGGGGRFIAGGDLRALAALRTEAEAASMSRRMQGVTDALAALAVPVIAAVDRFAYGGGAEVAVAADLRVLAPDAVIGFRHGRFNVVTAWGGARRLTALVGPARALRLLMDGDDVTAAEGVRIGLVDRIATGGATARVEAERWAAEIAARPGPVTRANKALVRAAAPQGAAHQTGLETRLFASTWAAPAHWEAVDAFWASRRSAASAAETVHREQEGPTGMQTGHFIVFEGIDGAGTTTQARLLSRWLRRLGRSVHETAEPSGGPVGVLLRQALGRRVVARDGSRLGGEAIAGLFAADRADHLRTEIEPALAEGVDVVCDRYDHSSLAYQGAECPIEWVSALNAPMRRPDLVLLVQVDAETAGQRRAARRGTPEIYEVDDFQRRVAALYDEIPERYRPEDPVERIDGTLSARDVHRACRAAVLRRLPGIAAATGGA